MAADQQPEQKADIISPPPQKPSWHSLPVPTPSPSVAVTQLAGLFPNTSWGCVPSLGEL